MEDETQKGVGMTEEVIPEEQPASEVESEQEETSQSAQEKPESASQETDFPVDQDKQKQAFYAMRKRIEELESKTKQQDEDLDLVNLARGNTHSPDQGFQPVNPSLPGVEFDESDPATQAFLSKVQTAEQQANAARQEATAARAQLEDFEAWQAFPQLNPNSPTADRPFIRDVARQYAARRLEAIGQGKQPPRLVDVAKETQNRYEEIRSQAKEQGATEAQATLARKEAANLESRGTTVSVETPSDNNRIEELRRRVNRGDDAALTELIKLTDPYIDQIPEE